MEITLTTERFFHLPPRYSFEEGQARVEEKKISLVAGTFGSLLTRPKPDEIPVVYGEHRLEPFWHLRLHLHRAYDRQLQYSIPVSGPEVQQITLNRETITVDAMARGGPAAKVSAVEHCVDEQTLAGFFTGSGAPFAETEMLLSKTRSEIKDLAAFQPEGVILVPPEAEAAAVARQLLAQVLPPTGAPVIKEERVTLEADLIYCPVYAFECHWAAKNKRMVIEVDGLTGEIRSDGKTLKAQLKTMLKSEALLEAGLEAAETLIPGGNLAAKLVRAVTDRTKK